ncbi:MAG: DUF4065 domain-containing protein [bacterium]|nr:DUF4065 domain-containing protein [bacterium]
MKSPVTGKEMSIQVRNMEIIFRKEVFFVNYPSFYCKDSNEYFTDTVFDTIKMKQVYNQYRDKHNLPFPEEIKEIRGKYGLSATKMSELLGFGINSYRNYESGEVPSQANANLIQLASDPRKFKTLVELSSFLEEDSFEKESLLKIVDKLILDKEKEDNMFFVRFEDYLLGKSLPDMNTGYIGPNLKKLTEMIVFFAERFKPYKTQLNKLLFYSDFYYYRLNAASISGTRYRAIERGPVPDNYDSIFDYVVRNHHVNIKESVWSNGFSEEFVSSPDRKFNSELFNEAELMVLEKVNTVFSGKSTKEIVDISHEEDAWIENFNNGKSLIDYKYAFNLKYLS